MDPASVTHEKILDSDNGMVACVTGPLGFHQLRHAFMFDLRMAIVRE
jgi:hypothetical protein